MEIICALGRQTKCGRIQIFFLACTVSKGVYSILYSHRLSKIPYLYKNITTAFSLHGIRYY